MVFKEVVLIAYPSNFHLGGMIQFEDDIVLNGWFNHQLGVPFVSIMQML